MGNDRGDKKIIILAVLALILLIAIFVMLFLRSSEDTNNEEKYVSFPDSQDRPYERPVEDDEQYNYNYPETEEQTVATSSDDIVEVPVQPGSWKDEVVVSENSSAEEPVTQQVPTYEYKAPYGDDTDPDRVKYIGVSIKPSTPPFFDGSAPQDNPYESINIYPSLGLNEAGAKNCGTTYLIGSNLDNDNTLVCIGEAIADNCSNAVAKFDMGSDISFTAYVAEREDSTCGFGVTYFPTSVSLCKVSDLMNYISKDNRSFTYWSNEFDDDPGGMMERLLGPEGFVLSRDSEDEPEEFPEDSIAAAGLSIANVSSVDCQKHKVY